MTIQEIKQKKDYLNSLRAFTLKEAEKIKNDTIQINVRPASRPEELNGITSAYSYIDYLMQEESSFPYPKGYRHPLTESLLQDINRIILQHYSCFMPFEKGFYRRGQAMIDETVLPSSDVFIPRLKELISYYQEDNSDFISKLAYFHLEFLTAIHPFCDGNGRTARTFMNLELAREGYPMIGLKYSDVESYYAAFTSYIKQKDQMPMEQLILTNLDSELERQIQIKRA